MTKDYQFNIHIHNIGILVGITFIFNIVAFGLETKKLHLSKFLASASFFVFAIHEPWLTLVRKVFLLIFNKQSDFSFLIIYFVPVFIIVFIALSLYIVLSKIIPNFLGIITGNRS